MTGASQPNPPIAASLAVWDIPSPAVAGERFTITVGVKSAADSDLRGRRIEVCDAAGAVIGEGRLGDTPWAQTRALYWAGLSLPAPATEGLATLSVRFRASGLEPPHADAAYRFSVAVARAPEHTLTVKVVAKETAAPIEHAQIRLGAYRAATDRSGLAELRMCGGSYELQVWKVGYDAPPAAVEVTADRHIQVEAVTVPEENVDRAWKS